jgi:hypothetical protein
MKKIVILAIAILSVLMLVSLYPTRAYAANGSRTDLDIVWYTNSDTAFTALQADEVDMIQWSLTNEQRVSVEGNPNLQIASYVENGMMEFDLNNNKTIIDYPTNKNPVSVLEFRRFLARMVDKDYIISNILLNMGSRIDVPVCYPQYQGWVDPDYVTYDWNGNGVIDPSEDNYPYPYSVTEAVNLLVDMGFSDTNADGYLEYPNKTSVANEYLGHCDGTNTVFQTQDCHKPLVEGSVTVYLNATPVPPADYTVNYPLGIITFIAPPEECFNVYASYQYYFLGHPVAERMSTTQMRLKICIRLDHAHRDAAGRMLVAALEGNTAVANDGLLATSPQWAVRGVIGGDLDTTDVQFEAERPVLSPIVMGAHNDKGLLERCGTENGYLNEARRGSVRPSGLRIKRAGA